MDVTLFTQRHLHHIKRRQDPVQVRLGHFTLDWVGAIPLFMVAIISTCFILRWILPRPPMWLTNFVTESKHASKANNSPSMPNLSSWSSALFTVSAGGCIVQTIGWFHHEKEVNSLFIMISWALAAALVALTRPTSTSWSLIALYMAIFVAQSVPVVNSGLFHHWSDLLDGFSLLASACNIAIAACMPMRPHTLTRQGISPVGEKPTKLLRTPEDDITLWQWMTVTWMTPLISLGKVKQLDDNDIWSLGYEFQHRRLYDSFRILRGSVLRRLLNANGLDMIILCLLGVIELLSFCSLPIIFQQLLATMENPKSPTQAAVVFAVLYLAASLIDTQCCCFGAWIGRRACERSRGEMITMMYDKTLKRKLSAIPLTKRDKDSLDDRHNVITDLPKLHQNKLTQTYQKVKKLTMKPIRTFTGTFSEYQTSPESIKPASTGKMLNMVKADVFEVAQLFWHIDGYIKRPGHIIVSIIFIWRLLGPACLLGALTIILAQVATAMIARILVKWEKVRRATTDVRLHAVSQFVEAIRHLRWYGWQDAWQSQIIDKRQKELNLRVITSVWKMLIMLVDGLASGMFPVVAFYVYTVLQGKPLRLDLAFPALTLFRNLEYNLKQFPTIITKLLNAYVALQRIEDFMNEPDKPEPEKDASVDQHLILSEVSFAWPGRQIPILSDISLIFKVGLNVVYGKVAAGKTTLLLGLLGELDQMAGDYDPPNSVVGYCEQTPWLQGMSIKDNILFYSQYNETRYKEVLEACSLTSDFANFKHGDESMIGENGVGLSGGQRARVALARAVYAPAKVLMLDDPLSALDHQTAQSIVQNCLKGTLIQGRTVILVTHRLDICGEFADQLIEVKDGTAKLVKNEATFKTRALFGGPKSLCVDALDPTEVAKKSEITETIIEEEHREQGGVKLSVFWEYIKAGQVQWWLCLVTFLAINRTIAVGQSWFLKEWGEAYNQLEQQSTPISRFFASLPSPESNARPWLLAFLAIAFARTLANLVSQGFMLAIGYCAGKRMFRGVLQRVAHASFRFYDVTPTGRLMNRMVSDMGMIDDNVSRQFQEIAELSTSWITSIAVIASVSPAFFVYSLAMTGAFIYFFLQFLPTSHSLRRLGVVSLSPLMSDFGDLVSGLSTVRAFGVQSRFQDRNIQTVDSFQKMDHFYWSLQAWLNYRFDLLADFSIFLLVMIALYTDISPGLVAFALVSTQEFIEATHSICTCYGQLQMDFVSVERVVELLRLEQEPPGEVSPPAWWPLSTGDLSFSNATIRYAPNLDPVINNLSFKIKGGSTTVIAGRTGAGKSTLALSLLGITLPDVGSIHIDGIDVGKVDKQALRSRVTFLAQDPILFPGSLRSNLDPLNEFSDTSCSRVISRVAPSYDWTLQTIIDAGGRNLSQGQRQLIGLARAILRRSSVVILDEATASIDLETSREALNILREELQGATIVMIAHRVDTVQVGQRYAIIGKGSLVEEGQVGSDGELIAERKQRHV